MPRTPSLFPRPPATFDTSALWNGPAKDIVFKTEHGALIKGDCLKALPNIASESIDTIFADPPFNIGKDYGKKVNDNLASAEYLAWCKAWMLECNRILKPGGAFFLYNLPKWNIILGNYMLDMGLDFRHWIAISIKLILPIPGRLYPAHYSLLYYTKGKPKTFRKIRTPIELCRHCNKEIKDYGGHRGAMNDKGVNLMDVWTDVPLIPVTDAVCKETVELSGGYNQGTSNQFTFKHSKAHLVDRPVTA